MSKNRKNRPPAAVNEANPSLLAKPPSSPSITASPTTERLATQLKELRLPMFRENFQALADQAVQE